MRYRDDPERKPRSSKPQSTPICIFPPKNRPLFWSENVAPTALFFQLGMGHDLDLVEKKLRDTLQQTDAPEPCSIWQHYKGDYYYIEGLVVKESTEEIEVCYSKVGGKIAWTRPLSEWNETMKIGNIGTKRFVKIEDSSINSNMRINCGLLAKPKKI